MRSGVIGAGARGVRRSARRGEGVRVLAVGFGNGEEAGERRQGAALGTGGFWRLRTGDVGDVGGCGTRSCPHCTCRGTRPLPPLAATPP